MQTRDVHLEEKSKTERWGGDSHGTAEKGVEPRDQLVSNAGCRQARRSCLHLRRLRAADALAGARRAGLASVRKEGAAVGFVRWAGSQCGRPVRASELNPRPPALVPVCASLCAAAASQSTLTAWVAAHLPLGHSVCWLCWGLVMPRVCVRWGCYSDCRALSCPRKPQESRVGNWNLRGLVDPGGLSLLYFSATPDAQRGISRECSIVVRQLHTLSGDHPVSPGPMRHQC